MDAVNAGLPHYRQIRAFRLVPEAVHHGERLIDRLMVNSEREASRGVSGTEIEELYQRKQHEFISGKDDCMGETGGVIQLSLQHPPYNEIGSQMLEELEEFTPQWSRHPGRSHALVIYSALETGFCAGADLRELYSRAFGRRKRTGTLSCANFWSASTRYSLLWTTRL